VAVIYVADGQEDKQSILSNTTASPCFERFVSELGWQVHVVWSEHSKPYRRETIATKFCDVLIVLERADSKMYRVRVETVSALEFGPLYDGALVGSEELAELVRLTVVR
ncbi:hypothetical protein TELCIR_25109, partial [Teladorsagia circumcincta]